MRKEKFEIDPEALQEALEVLETRLTDLEDKVEELTSRAGGAPRSERDPMTSIEQDLADAKRMLKEDVARLESFIEGRSLACSRASTA